jgi:transposase
VDPGFWTGGLGGAEKLLAWDGSGMMLVTKWLHQGRFTWPPIRDGVVHVSATQLAMLLDASASPRATSRSRR